MTTITRNLNLVQTQIADCCKLYNRRVKDVLLVAVSKTKTSTEILEAVKAGQLDFGENYLQEALAKIKELGNSQIRWHFIGRIQSNKAKEIANNFNWAHSVSSIKVAEKINKYRPDTLGKINICLQVNIENSATKSGFEPDQIEKEAKLISKLPNLCLRGLMVIPEPTNDFKTQRHIFHKLCLLKQQMNQNQNLNLDTLSMGMSNDLQAAIAEGATIVRIGTSIFGQRTFV